MPTATSSVWFPRPTNNVTGAPVLREALLVNHNLGDRWRVASVLEIVGSALVRHDAPRG